MSDLTFSVGAGKDNSRPFERRHIVSSFGYHLIIFSQSARESSLKTILPTIMGDVPERAIP
jgi:hypothetical protein